MPSWRPGSLADDRRRDQEWFGDRGVLRLTLQVPASRGKGIQAEAAHLYGANFYDHYLLGKLDSYKLMIAQYTKREPVLKDGRDFEMWQYTGKGKLNGINGYVDKSRFTGRHRLREIRFRHR